MIGNHAMSELAYIAVTNTGYVEGACLVDSDDSPGWVGEMEGAGMAVQQLPMDEAKDLLFTHLPQATLEA